MNEDEVHVLDALPVAQSCRLINFETADVLGLLMFPQQNILVVSGHKPYVNMNVDLVPLVYVQQPDYWGIEVVGNLPGLDVAAMTPYVARLQLNGLVGRTGIEVIGANRTEQIQLHVPEEAAQFVGQVDEGRLRHMFPPWIPDEFLRLTTISVNEDAPPEVGEVDLSRYSGMILRVRGDYQNGWIYSANVVEEVPESLLSIIARQVFSKSAE